MDLLSYEAKFEILLVTNILNILVFSTKLLFVVYLEAQPTIFVESVTKNVRDL